MCLYFVVSSRLRDRSETIGSSSTQKYKMTLKSGNTEIPTKFVTEKAKDGSITNLIKSPEESKNVKRNKTSHK